MTDAAKFFASTSIMPLGNTLSLFLLITYLICVGFGLLLPGRFHMYQAWAPLLPGFEWLTLKGFLFGFIGSYLYGWYIAVIVVPLYHIFSARN